MKSLRKYLKKLLLPKSLIISAVIFLFSFGSAAAVSGTPTIINYQARLTNSSGNLVTGTYYFKFSIWDNPTVGSGNQLWPTTAGAPHSTSTTVTQGVFNIKIGDTANGYPDPLNYNFNTNNTVYLQVEVSSDNASFEKLSPRKQISSAAFAQVAGAVSGTSTPSSFGTTTPIGNSIVTIEASSSGAVPLSIRGASGQSANIFQIQDSTSANLLYLNSSGSLFASSSLQVSGTSVFYSNLGIGTSTPGSLLAVQGNALISGNLNVANITATGTLTVAGTITFNNASTTGMLTIGNGFISSASSTVAGPFQVSGVLNASSTISGGTTTINNLIVTNTSTSTFTGGVSANTLGVTGTSSLAGLSAGFGTFSGNLLSLGNLDITGTSTLNGLSAGFGTFSSNLVTSKDLNVSGLSSLSGFISSASSTVSNTLQVTGNIQASSSVSIGGVLALTGTTGTSTIANGQGFTIGSTQLVLQQGSGKVGIGTNDPSTLLHIKGSSPIFRLDNSDNIYWEIRGAASQLIFADQNNGQRAAIDTSGNLYLSAGNFKSGTLGSASAPAFTFFNDDDTGIFSGDNILGFVTGGLERSRINSSGQLGIATNTPGALLAVQGNALISGNLNVANINATGTLTIPYASTTMVTMTNGFISSASSTLAGSLQIAGVLQASSTISAGTTTITNLIVTNTSTSTIAGGFAVQTNKLVVDKETGNVGVGTTTPGSLFSVAGDSLLGGLTTIYRAIFGSISATGTLDVSGLSTFSGLISTASSTFSNNLNVSGPLSASSTLNVGGLAYLSGFISTASSTISNSLNVSGPLSASSTLSVAGLATQVGGFISSASSTVSSNLLVSGVFNASSTISGGTTTINNLIVTNTSTSTIAGGLAVQTNKLVVDKETGNVGVGTTTPGSLFSVAGNSLFDGLLTAYRTLFGSMTATGTLNVSGLSALTGGFISSASSTVAGNFHVSGVLNASSTLLANGLSVLTGGFISSASSTVAGSLQVAGNLQASSTVSANALFVVGNTGIGTTSPGALFAVQGNALLAGNLWANNITATGTITVTGTSGTSTIGSITIGPNGRFGFSTTTPNIANFEVATRTIAFNSGADGSLGSWSTANALPGIRGYHSSVTANGYAYVIGGTDGSFQSTIYYAKLNSDGSTGAWATNANALPGIRGGHSSVAANGYVYVIGGRGIANALQSTIYYTSTARIMVSGNLDLLGLASTTLSDSSDFGSNGSSIFAGDIFSNGKLEVTGNSMLWNGLGVNGLLSVTASSSNQQNVPIFSIQNATGTVPLFQVLYNGLATLSNGFISSASSTVAGSLQVAGPLSASSTLSVAGLATQVGGFISSASSTISSNLLVSGFLNASSSAAIGGALSVGGNITIPTGGYGLFINGNNSGLSLVGGQNTSGGASISIFGIDHSTLSNVIQFNRVTGGESARIDTNGRLGIGTTSPSQPLSVHGGALIAGTTTVNGLIATGSVYITGNVGIGTTNPIGSLDVKGVGNTAGSIGLQLRSGNSSEGFLGNQIVFGNSGTTDYNQAIKTRHNNATNNNAFDFYTWQTGDVAGDIGSLFNMTINGGKVGVGTTSPSQRLSVHGNGLFSGNLSLANLTATGTLTFANASTTGMLTIGNGFISSASSTVSSSLNVSGSFIASSSVALAGEVVIGPVAPTGFGRALTIGAADMAINVMDSDVGGTGIGIEWKRNNGTADLGISITGGQVYFSGRAGDVFNFRADGSNNGLTLDANELATLVNATTTQLTVTNNTYLATAGGSVGIGTTTPGKKLVLETGTHQDGINLVQTNSAFDTGFSINNRNVVSYFGGWSTTKLFINGMADWTGGVEVGSFAGSKTSNLLINGNVGIGTDSPDSNLDVVNTGAGADNIILTLQSDSGTPAAEDIARIDFKFSDAGGNQDVMASVVGVDEDPAEGTEDGGLAFYTRAAGGSVTEKVRLGSTGNLGIGTTTPGALFSVQGNALLAGNLWANNITATGTIGINANQKLILNSGTDTAYLTRSTAGTAHVLIYSDGNQPLDIGNGGLSVGTYANVTSAPSNGIIVSGNVGVGASSPVAKLQVNTTSQPGVTTWYNPSAMMIVGTSTNGGSTLANPETILTLSRNGVGGTAYDNFARFDLKRYVNSGVSSKTQLDIRLSDGDLNSEGNNTPTIMSLQSGGNVGIGTTTPGALLAVHGNALIAGTTTVRTLVATDTLSVGVTRLVVDASGKVGIGTDAPAAGLDMRGFQEMRIGGSAAPFLGFYHTDNSTLYGRIGIATAANHFLTGSAQGDTIIAGQTSNSKIHFGQVTNDNLVMTVDGQNERVGIGTVNPGNKLEVNGGGNDVISSILSGGTAKYAVLATGRTAIENYIGTAQGVDGLSTGAVAGDLVFRTENKNMLFNVNAGNNAAMYIKSDSKVGIGTTTPGALFAVQGNGLFSGNLSLANLIATGSITTTGTASSSISQALGIASSTPWGTLSVEMGEVNPSFVVSNNGSSTPSFWIGGVNQNGFVGIGTSTPDQPLTVFGNISNLQASTSMRLVGQNQAAVNTASKSDLQGKYLFSGTQNGVFEIWDVSTSTPALVNSLTIS
ncbi:MAG: hypothetical protein Q7S73_02740, partial [bacterium]|nr:hypothetical protein [bacterium]